MIEPQDILAIDGSGAFERAAMELFAFQARNCAPYAEYLELMEINPDTVDCCARIPFMPVEVFKNRDVYCAASTPEKIFTSSATGGMQPSRHMLSSLSHYERCFTRAFEMFYGPVERWSIFALLPSYLERGGSSLVFMMDSLIRHSRGGGFFLHDTDELLRQLEACDGPRLLLGVSYALLDLAERGCRVPPGTVVMETGGMKGRRQEMAKSAMHAVLCRGLGVQTIHSEYGMAEMTSQAYSQADGIFTPPPWVRVVARDVNDPLEMLPAGCRGGLNIIDLGNLSSCAFLQTRDAGRVWADGRFEVLGRLAGSEIRGCNLLVQ